MKRDDFVKIVPEIQEMLFSSVNGCVCPNSPGLCERCRSDKDLGYELGLWLSREDD